MVRGQPYSEMYLVSPAIFERMLNCLDKADQVVLDSINQNPSPEEQPRRPSQARLGELYEGELGPGLPAPIASQPNLAFQNLPLPLSSNPQSIFPNLPDPKASNPQSTFLNLPGPIASNPPVAFSGLPQPTASEPLISFVDLPNPISSNALMTHTNLPDPIASDPGMTHSLPAPMPSNPHLAIQSLPIPMPSNPLVAQTLPVPMPSNPPLIRPSKIKLPVPIRSNPPIIQTAAALPQPYIQRAPLRRTVPNVRGGCSADEVCSVSSTEQPKRCHICNKFFTRQWNLARHMQTVHSADPSQYLIDQPNINNDDSDEEAQATFPSGSEGVLPDPDVHMGSEQNFSSWSQPSIARRPSFKTNMRPKNGRKRLQERVDVQIRRDPYGKRASFEQWQ